MIDLPEAAKLSIKQIPFQILDKNCYLFIMNRLANKHLENLVD